MNKEIAKLSIVIPVYNEIETLKLILDKVNSVSLPLSREIILVDDGSNDGSTELIKNLTDNTIKTIFHEVNMGKGAALRSGFEKAAGDVILVQDADLEYDPSDYSKLLAPILDGKADVVYGSRFVGSEAHRVLYFWHMIGNKFLTLLSNILSSRKNVTMKMM